MTSIRRNHFLPFTVLAYAMAFPSTASSVSLEIKGGNLPVIAVSPDQNSGLDGVYVVADLNDCILEYASDSADKVRWYAFKNLGGAFSEEINEITVKDNKSSVKARSGSCGYIVEDNGRNHCFWVVDYSESIFEPHSVKASEHQSCDATLLDVDSSCAPIHYYTVNGRQETLSREIPLRYQTLEWDSESKLYRQVEKEVLLANLPSQVSVYPPVYCSTDFTISEDRFQRQWGQYSEIRSANFNPYSVAAVTEAEQLNTLPDGEDLSNIITSGEGSLGGSAPVDISFRAYVTDAVVHSEWQLARDEEFEDVAYRIYSSDFEYTFTEDGTLFARFIASNADGSCEAYGDIYPINIGSSVLKIPNAFSPDGDGINDEWKVAYRSLVDFSCSIFDRNGHQVYSFDNPATGWDGKRNGKAVNPGVYFYVIQAVGADGKKYKKSGDINILRHNDQENISEE